MKVKKVAPSSGLERNLLLAAVAWVASRLGSDSGDGARKPTGKAKRRPAARGKAKSRPAGSPSGKAGAASDNADKNKADKNKADKNKAAAEKAARKARAKTAAMPPKVVAKQSKKVAKLTKKSRASK
jgi:hypothetical protein